MPTTLKDIAARAGVSLSVVSAVLNNKSRNSRVSATTRARILKIADQLQYIPNITAQHLRDKVTNTVNVVIPSFAVFEVDHHIQLVKGLQAYLVEHGYSLQVTSLDAAFRDDKLIKYIHTDGIILFYWGMQEQLIREFGKLDVPMVLINGRDPESRYPNVYRDIAGGMAELTAEVLKRGHTNIAYLNTYPGDITHQDALAGVRRAADRRPDVSLRIIDLLPDRTLDAEMDQGVHMGKKGLELAMADASRPTVVMCNDDVVALAAIKKAQDMGLAVPDDVSIIGSGNFRIGAASPLPLATTENTASEEGCAAGELILEHIKDKGNAGLRKVISVRAIVRESLKDIR